MVRLVIMDDAETRLAPMSEEWTVILASSSGDREVTGSWEQSIDSMRREADSLRDQGRWRGGHRTLMHALGPSAARSASSASVRTRRRSSRTTQIVATLSIASAFRFQALHPTRCGSRWAGRVGGC